MDRRERFEDNQSAMLAALQGLQADLWTSLPGIVQSFNAAKQTCTVQVTIKFKITQPALSTYASKTMVVDPSGDFAWDQMPILTDCPVYFPTGGGVTLTFPVTKGDECLVVFASRCIDAWWQNGNIQNQPILRMHDLSDGFAFVGVNSVPNVIPNIQTAKAQFRTDDGNTYIELDPATHDVNVVSTGKVTVNATGNVVVTTAGSATVSASAPSSITAPTITLNGNVVVNGTFTQSGGGAAAFSGSLAVSGMLTGQGTNVHTHVHSGVQSGGSNTGAPV